MSIKARFDQFVANICPTPEHFAEADRQTNYMIERLIDQVAANNRFTLRKILHAGSNAKHTSLLRTEDNVFDVDLGAYFSGAGATKTELGTLLRFTQQQLRAIYPTKPAEDFTIGRSAVCVVFRSGIELHVDVAPIICDDSLGIENGGWIPRADGEWRLTSVTCHNEFVRTRSARSRKRPGPVKFNQLVRLVKWWNNQQGSLAQPSIFCDLITAAAFEQTGVTDEWQTSLRGVFGFLRKHRFLEPIVFNDYYDPKSVTIRDQVVVLDSVNKDNNITKKWTEATRVAYLERVQLAYDAMVEAHSAELDDDEDGAVDAWCDVFGEAFRTLSVPEEGA
jgi:hypothetical protein